MDENAFSKKIFSYLRTEKKDVLSIYLYAILGGVVYLSIPLGIQAIVSYALGATMVTSIYILIGAVTLGTFLAGYFQIRIMKIIEKLQQKIFVEYAWKFAEKIPKVDMAYVNKYNLQELVNRFFDTQNLQKGISKILLVIPVAIVQIVVSLLLLSFYHPYFIGFALIIVLLIILIFRITKDNGITTSLEESHYKYDVAAWLEDIARDVKSFKNNAFLEVNLNETDNKLIQYLKYRTAHFKILLFQYKALVFFKVSITAFMLILGVYLLINQKINIGAFVATEIVILTIMTAMENLVKSLEKYYDIATAYTKLHKVLDLKEENNGSIEIAMTDKGVDIEAVEVTFGLSEEKPIINNLSGKFARNQISLITGKPGSGKTVLIDLLSGFYVPSYGKILLNGTPINNYQKQHLRKYIGLLMNDLDVIKGSVIQNINLGNPKITAEQINSLAQDLGINNFASLFSDGLLTEIQASDKRLSNFTKKSILLIRALIGEKRLLILEDPLDGFSEGIQKHLLKFLKTASKDKTIIIVGKQQNYQPIVNDAYELKDGQLHRL